MNNDPLLNFYKNQLEDLEKDYKSVQDQLRVELDRPTQNRLERNLEQIGQRMNEWQQKIDKHQADQQLQASQIALDALINILKTHETQLEVLIKAYQQAIRHWTVPVQPDVNTADAIINELERIAPGSAFYTAREEFIAHVVHLTSDPSLANALNQWGTQYRAGINWLELHAKIQKDQDKRLEKAQPAILMTITRSDQESTQAQEDETYYQLNAWLIENIETYRSQKVGYHSLISIDSIDAKPFLLNDLLQRLPHLLNQFLVEQRRVCSNCQNYPEIHVFLPLGLMHLGVDVFLLESASPGRQQYLGHDHIVVIRCANRYDGAYNKRPSWLSLWTRHERLLKEIARNVFVSGHDDDLDELMDILDRAVQPDSKIVGLQVHQEPTNTEELCYELLDSGLPLAIWTRRNLATLAHETELSNLLAACCLEHLPRTVKAKRYETRRRQNTPDCHIGHHLSLLWDDPHLIPPKSA